MLYSNKNYGGKKLKREKTKKTKKTKHKTKVRKSRKSRKSKKIKKKGGNLWRMYIGRTKKNEKPVEKKEDPYKGEELKDMKKVTANENERRRRELIARSYRRQLDDDDDEQVRPGHDIGPGGPRVVPDVESNRYWEREAEKEQERDDRRRNPF